jgi:sugar phosphate isomerase/epimerase
MISIQMYTLREFMKTPGDLQNTLKRVSEIGYRYVQISIPSFISTLELKAELDKHSLKADSVFAPLSSVHDNLNDILKSTESLGTNIVRTDGIPRELAKDEDGFRCYAKRLQSAGELLKKFGLKLMYHNHTIEYTNFENCTGMDILLKETDPQNVMFQPDVHHMAAAGLEVSHALYDFKGRCEYIHMQGYAIIPGDGLDKAVPRRTVPVGTGNLYWGEIVKTALNIGVRIFVVEQDYCIGNPFDEIALSYRNMKKLLEGSL